MPIRSKPASTEYGAADDRACAEILQVMDFGVAVATSTPVSAMYLELFEADYPAAAASAAAAAGAGSPHQSAVRDQVLALTLGAPVCDLDLDEVDLTTDAGAMAVFHTSEAIHLTGQIQRCRGLLTDALDRGVPSRRPRTWLRLALSRALLFEGRVAEGMEHLGLATQDASTPLSRRSAEVMWAALKGVSGDVDDVVEIAERFRLDTPEPASYADSGMAFMIALGLASSGLPHAASELLLHGCGGAGLGLLPPTLRAYAYDVLIESSIGTGRVELAHWMLLDYDRIDFGDNPQMQAIREASRARVEAATGSGVPALGRAATAAERTLAIGHQLFGARAALVAAGAAAESEADPVRLERLLAHVSTADLTDWVHRSLDGVGRHLRALPGAGWDQLTATQEAVARLAARGLSNAEIAEALVVSPRTVEGHIAALLDRLGVANRIGIIHSATGRRSADPRVLAGLTPRQREVAELIAAGVGNSAIGDRLGIGAKTVEQHVRSVFRALGVSTRAAAVAKLVGS